MRGAAKAAASAEGADGAAGGPMIACTSRSARRLAVLLALAAVVLSRAPVEATGLLFDAFGADAGGPPRVKVFVSTAQQIADFLAFEPTFRGGVRVAVGDVNGDGIDDVVVGAGPGGGSRVMVFRGTCSGTFTFPVCSGGVFGVDSSAPIASFFAFDPTFTGGVYVAVGDLDPSNDAAPCVRSEIVVGAGAGGGPHVKVFRNAATGGSCPAGGPATIDPASPIASFFAAPPAFTGGIRVATGDLNDDGLEDVITGTRPGGPLQVHVFRNVSSGGTFGLDPNPAASFLIPTFTGGVFVTAVDVNGDFLRDVVLGADAGPGPGVLVIRNMGGFTFDTAAPLALFAAFEDAFTGGVRVGRLALGGGFFPMLYVMPGPGGPGVARTFGFIDGVPTETLFGATPFGFSPRGAFPAQ